MNEYCAPENTSSPRRLCVWMSPVRLSSSLSQPEEQSSDPLQSSFNDGSCAPCYRGVSCCGPCGRFLLMLAAPCRVTDPIQTATDPTPKVTDPIPAILRRHLGKEIGAC